MMTAVAVRAADRSGSEYAVLLARQLRMQAIGCFHALDQMGGAIRTLPASEKGARARRS